MDMDITDNANLSVDQQSETSDKRNISSPEPSPEAPDSAVWSWIGYVLGPFSCGKPFYFDPRGDLTLKVGDVEEEAVFEFVVCSNSLARLSPVFGAMLFTGFGESRPKDDSSWTVEMPEDRVCPVFLVLSIVHGKYTNIPETLEQDELYELLVVTEKYDMTRILRPWASTLFQPFKDTSSLEGKEIVMWISWELGHEATFRSHSMNLLLKSQIDDDGQLLDSSGVPLNTYMFLEPPGILDRIAQTRKEVVESILNRLQDAVQDAETGKSCIGSTRIPEVQVTQKQCAIMTLGFLVVEIKRAGLGDVVLLQTDPLDYQGSVNELLSLVEGMQFSLHYSHPECNPMNRIQENVKTLVENIPSPVTDQHLKRLQKQAEKTGV